MLDMCWSVVGCVVVGSFVLVGGSWTCDGLWLDPYWLVVACVLVGGWVCWLVVGCVGWWFGVLVGECVLFGDWMHRDIGGWVLVSGLVLWLLV